MICFCNHYIHEPLLPDLIASVVFFLRKSAHSGATYHRTGRIAFCKLFLSLRFNSPMDFGRFG